MTARNVTKLLKAGFTILKREETKDRQQKDVRRIWAKTNERREWHVMAKDFLTKNALDQRMANLLIDDMIVEIYE